MILLASANTDAQYRYTFSAVRLRRLVFSGTVSCGLHVRLVARVHQPRAEERHQDNNATLKYINQAYVS